MHAREEVRIDNVLRPAINNALFVTSVGIRFGSRDKCRPDIGEVSTTGLRSEDRMTVRDGPRQCDRAIEPLSNLADQGER